MPSWLALSIAPSTDPSRRELRRRLWSAWAAAILTTSGVATVFGIVLVAVMVTAGYSFMGFNLIGFAAHSIVWAVGMGVGITIGRGLWLIVGRYRAHAERLILLEGLCPTCSYDLAGVDPAEAELVPCPECGSRWRAGRIGPDAQEAEPSVIAWSHHDAVSSGGPPARRP